MKVNCRRIPATRMSQNNRAQLVLVFDFGMLLFCLPADPTTGVNSGKRRLVIGILELRPRLAVGRAVVGWVLVLVIVAVVVVVVLVGVLVGIGKEC